MFSFKKTLILCSMMMPLILGGCGNNTLTTKNDPDPNAYIEDLEPDVFYVRTKDTNECKAIYFGAATFDESSTVSSPRDNRVAWFNDEMYKNIPTLYEGDSLIYKTSEEVNETVIFERFEDFGYSIGLCQLTPTPSGRYSISTVSNDNNTFPNGDTDELLLLTNENVIIDTIGGVKLRAPQKTEQGNLVNSQVTRVNSIANLEKGKLYEAEIYEGSKLHKYKFTANIRIMGSMEVVKSTDYVYESEKLIRIEIPKEFHSGYYMVNGAGVFRLVRGNEYIEGQTDFNEPNENNESKGEAVIDSINNNNGVEDKNTEYQNNKPVEYDAPDLDIEDMQDYEESIFTLSETGIVEVTAKITNCDNPDLITGIVVDPTGEYYLMDNNGNILNVEFEATITGDYSIQLYDMNGAKANIDVSIY